MDQSLKAPGWSRKNSQQRAGYLVVTINKIIEVEVLGPRTSAPNVELITFNRTLLLFQGKKVNIYMDFKYAFMVVHSHGAI